MNFAVVWIDLEPYFGGPLPEGYKLMIYMKFQTAMKHQSWPDYPMFTTAFLNDVYAYFGDDMDNFEDDRDDYSLDPLEWERSDPDPTIRTIRDIILTEK